MYIKNFIFLFMKIYTPDLIFKELGKVDRFYSKKKSIITLHTLVYGKNSVEISKNLDTAK